MSPLFGKCPNPACLALVTNVEISKVDAHDQDQLTAAAYAFLCPQCATVLGVTPDPDELVKRVQKVARSREASAALESEEIREKKTGI